MTRTITDVAYLVVREALAQVYHLVIAPRARAKWTEVKQNRRRAQGQVSGDASASKVVASDHAQVDEPSTDLVAQRPATVMDSVEFRQRLALMLAAENFAAEQRQLLSAVQISDEANLPPQLADAMKLVLEEDTASLDHLSLQLLIDFLVTSDAELVEPVGTDHGAMSELEIPDDVTDAN